MYNQSTGVGQNRQKGPFNTMRLGFGRYADPTYVSNHPHPWFFHAQLWIINLGLSICTTTLFWASTQKKSADQFAPIVFGIIMLMLYLAGATYHVFVLHHAWPMTRHMFTASASIASLMTCVLVVDILPHWTMPSSLFIVGAWVHVLIVLIFVRLFRMLTWCTTGNRLLMRIPLHSIIASITSVALYCIVRGPLDIGNIGVLGASLIAFMFLDLMYFTALDNKECTVVY